MRITRADRDRPAAAPAGRFRSMAGRRTRAPEPSDPVDLVDPTTQADPVDPIDPVDPPVRGAPRGPSARPSGMRRAIALALILAVTGAGLLVLAGRLRDGSPAANRALLDTDATTRVIGDVTDALTRIFSYAPDDTAATEKAAGDVLAGAAAEQYRRLFAQVKRQAPAQRLTLTTRVVRAGVTTLSGDSAHLLVFLDQATARDGRPSGTVAAAQLSVTARLTAGHWRITDLRSS
ncbi:hypothetical protein ACRYCC_23855 [Actinomadura scrupuli]|uniref:hypothetical protein n=1 Tax=Actinomadura scrupuli TaxID=559629 RepID=UPI003D960954